MMVYSSTFYLRFAMSIILVMICLPLHFAAGHSVDVKETRRCGVKNIQ